jgi:tetratricopeptide (TPR) repeat protein
MIVGNSTSGLARCLESVAGLVDRIVIGATGSDEQLAEAVRGSGAEVFPVTWREDFADARNQVLARARGDWVLVLDADEMLDQTAPAAIEALLSGEPAWAYAVSFMNYVRQLGYRCGGEQARVNPGWLPQASAYPAFFRTNSLRLFRRDPRICFTHCVHETVIDSLKAAGLKSRRANFVIHHFGFVDDHHLVRREKDELYVRLAYKKLADSPGSSQAHLEAGLAELDSAKRAAPALEHFLRATALDPSQAVGWLYQGICRTRLGEYAAAMRDLARAAVLNPDNPLVHSAQGDVHFQQQNYALARGCYRQARSLGDASPLSLAKLGAAGARLGEGQQGLSQVQAAVAQDPGSGELLSILATTALLTGEHAIACDAASRRLAMDQPSSFDFVVAAAIHRHAGQPLRAEALLRQAALLFPGDPEVEAMVASVPGRA